MKKFLIALAATVAVTGTAAAAELRMSWWGGDGRHVATQAALKACGEKYGHTIQPEFTGFDGHQEKVTTQIAGGTEADIMQINWPWLPLLSKSGDGFADLNQFADTIDLKQWSADLLKTGTVKGKLNGIPVSMTGRVFYLNETLFTKAGVPVPTNWDELMKAAPVVKAKLGNDHYAFDAKKLNAILTVTLITAQITGKDMIDPATGQVAWTPAELQKGLEYYQKLVETGTIRSYKDATATGNVELFDEKAWADGLIGGSYEWDSTFQKYADPLKDAKLVPLKPFKISGGVSEGMYRKPSMVFAISKHSKNPKAAAQILNCLLNEKEGVLLMSDARGVPSSAAALKILTDANKLKPSLLTASKIVMESTGPTASQSDENPKVREILQDGIEEYAYGKASAADAAAQMIDDINDVLAKL